MDEATELSTVEDELHAVGAEIQEVTTEVAGLQGQIDEVCNEIRVLEAQGAEPPERLSARYIREQQLRKEVESLRTEKDRLRAEKDRLRARADVLRDNLRGQSFSGKGLLPSRHSYGEGTKRGVRN
jgi:chromosome segregation ATPase